MEDVLKVSGQCVCVCLCVCVPSSCIMTCSETTRSRSHLPLRAHNRHAGVIMRPAEESVLQQERVVVCVVCVLRVDTGHSKMAAFIKPG